MKNHILISYAGNKRQECENIFNYYKTLLNNNEINTIVEHFVEVKHLVIISLH